MFELTGKYNTAKVFTDNCEILAQEQIIKLLNLPISEGEKIRIMPDVHAGAGCTIGTTMTLTDKVIPNLVGVDIGCGMTVVRLGKNEIDCSKLDKLIRQNVPSGFSIREKPHDYLNHIDLLSLKCREYINVERAKLSLGTLGGGNHFIELDVDDDNNKYLVVHTGSRHLGLEVAKYYQRIAYEKLCEKSKSENKSTIAKLVSELKAQGRQAEIPTEIKKINLNKDCISEEFAWCENDLFYDYLNDMMVTQFYANLNRAAIIESIINQSYNGEVIIPESRTYDTFTTVHNYIDIDRMILRKGAVSAQNGEELIIPMNMRDGSLICIGKGNEDWNCSAPHGAGRLMSRSKAKDNITLDDYKKSMNGIYSTSVNNSTIDESPMAYKPMNEIIEDIKDTVYVLKIIKPIYNFKGE